MGEDLSIVQIAERVEADVLKAKERKITRRPRHVLSSYDIGDRCKRYLYHTIADWQDRKLHDAGTQALFDQGEWEAEASISDLRAAEYKLVNEETAFEIKVRNGVITGHADWFLTGGILGDERIPVEHKGLSYGQGDKWESWRDMLTAKARWVQRYPAQLQCYLWQSNSPRGLFAIRSKEAGRIKFLGMDIDEEFGESLLAKAEAVYDALAAEQPPERIPYDPRMCDNCDFAHLCEPEKHINVAEGGILFDPEREAQVKRYLELEPLAKEAADLKRDLQAVAKAAKRPVLVIGDGMLTYTEQMRQHKAQPATEARETMVPIVKIERRKETEE